MSDEAVVSEVSADNVRQHIEAITTEIPSRLAGSANGKRMAEYSRDALAASGVEATVYEMPGLVSFPERGELRILAPTELAIEANTLGHSVPTLPDGITGELIDVGSGAVATTAAGMRPARSRCRSCPTIRRVTKSSASLGSSVRSAA
jgi:hypothetical protein